MFEKGIPAQLHLSSRLDWINFVGGGLRGWGQQHNERGKKGRKKKINMTTDKQSQGLIGGENSTERESEPLSLGNTLYLFTDRKILFSDSTSVLRAGKACLTIVNHILFLTIA